MNEKNLNFFFSSDVFAEYFKTFFFLTRWMFDSIKTIFFPQKHEFCSKNDNDPTHKPIYTTLFIKRHIKINHTFIKERTRQREREREGQKSLGLFYRMECDSCH